eukprot:929612-Pyramimonas_sp.AAC.3
MPPRPPPSRHPLDPDLCVPSSERFALHGLRFHSHCASIADGYIRTAHPSEAVTTRRLALQR